MKLLHISDWHSKRNLFPEADLVICTGDMLPNKAWADAGIDVPFQTKYVESDFNRIITSKPVYCVRGNHDFIDIKSYFDSSEPVFEFKEPRVISTPFGRVAGLRGTKMWSSSTWSDSLEESDMAHLLNYLAHSDFEILLTHGPAYGELDTLTNGEHIGSVALADFLNAKKSVKLHLFGHIHEAFGFGKPLQPNLLSVNSATGWHLIEKTDTGFEVIDQGKL